MPVGATSRRLVAIAPLLVALAGCAESSAGEGDAAADAPPVSDEFWYVQLTIAMPEGRTSYLQLLDSIEGRRVGTENAIELAGNARVFVQGNRIFTGSAEEPVIQRWMARPDGSLEPGERISLAALGLSFIPFGNNFISDRKAYLFDGSAGLRTIVWNPSALEVTGEIDLTPIRKPEFLPELDPGVLIDNLLFAVVQQQDFAGGFNRGIQVAAFDTETDTIAHTIEDDRCVGNFSGLELGEDGTLYALGDNYLVRQWFDDTLPPSCLLRIRPGEVTFDPDFFVDFNAAADGLPCTGLFYRGDGRFLTTCMDESLGTVNPRDAPLTFFNEPTAYWYEIDATDPDRSRRLELEPISPRSGPGFKVDGRTFIQRPNAGFTGENALIEITDDNELVEVFTTTGLIVSFGKVSVNES